MSLLMEGYIKEQASMVKSILDLRKDISREFVSEYCDYDIERIFILGSGSSYHSGLMSQSIIESLLGIEVSVQVPTKMTSPDLIAGKKVLFLVISQSGKSTNTFSVIRQLKDSGHPVVAITDSDESPLAKEASLHVRNLCGEEIIGPKTKGVTGTVVTLDILALELALAKGLVDDTMYNSHIENFYRYVENLPKNIQYSLSWYERNKETLSRAVHIEILGQDTVYGAAMEGALKMLETLYRPVICYEFEEYLHGIACMLDEKSQLIFLLPNGKSRERTLRLSSFCAGKGAQCYLISRGDSDGSAYSLSLLTVGNKFIAPLEFLIPMQIISARLSEVFNNNIDKSKYPDFSRIMASKIQTY